MVKDEQKWIDLFEKYRKNVLAGRLRFQLTDLEEFIQTRLGGASSYQTAGGYYNLFQLLKKLEAEQKVKAIKSSGFNQRQPQLKKRWSVVKGVSTSWSDKDILKLSRQLDLSYYLKRPQKQTLQLKRMLFKTVDFLKRKNEREWASREERSLELFGDEKFLNKSAGKKLLSNLKLKLVDLKAQHYKHLFVYWTLNPAQINNILIMENHSAFIGAKKALAAEIDIFDQGFDTVIYGQGKKIVNSFSFLEELLGFEKDEQEIETENFNQNEGRKNLIDSLNIYYAGDLDPEGLSIYTSLKNKYPKFKIKLLVEYYQLLLEESKKFYPCQKQQNKNQQVIKEVVNEFKNAGLVELVVKFKQAWENDLRLPQELITFEVLKRLEEQK